MTIEEKIAAIEEYCAKQTDCNECLLYTCKNCNHYVSDDITEKYYNMISGNNSQAVKTDSGKPKLTLVPLRIIYDIAEVREYGIRKYHDPDNWKGVEVERYRNAAFRHLLAYLKNPNGVDEESGISHLKHLACNIAFLCELEDDKNA